MIRTFLNGGVVMWPMLAIAAGMVWIAVRTAQRLSRAEPPHDDIRHGLHALLFWGGMGVVLGFLGTVVGLIVMAQAAAMAGAVEARLLWGGVSVALISILFGLVLFLFGAVVWFGLRQWSLRVVGRAP